eukprot:SM000012S25387  [mRNA]  locus=s12:873839:877169:+ [translate_table: standard]
MDSELLPELELAWAAPQRVGPGLRNLGNTCYLNSVLQCLTYTPPLANFCLAALHSTACSRLRKGDVDSCPFCLLEWRIAKSLRSSLAVDQPQRMVHRLRHIAKHFRLGRQEDAHELLRLAVEACNKACVELHRIAQNRDRNGAAPRGHSSGNCLDAAGGGKSGAAAVAEPRTVVKDIFGGVLQSQVKCLGCGAESNTLDEFLDLSLDIHRPCATLSEALARFSSPEMLDGDNKYRCDRCKMLSAAQKQMTIQVAPTVLVLQFKRFGNIFGAKIDRHILFEERLSLREHMTCNSKDPLPKYLLYAIIVHSGYSQDSGHYYAYIKDSFGCWFCCDDQLVTPASPATVLAEKAYMLFFARTCPRTASCSGLGAQPTLSSSSSPSPPNTPPMTTAEPPASKPAALLQQPARLGVGIAPRPMHAAQLPPLPQPRAKLLQHSSEAVVSPKPDRGASSWRSEDALFSTSKRAKTEAGAAVMQPTSLGSSAAAASHPCASTGNPPSKQRLLKDRPSGDTNGSSLSQAEAGPRSDVSALARVTSAGTAATGSVQGAALKLRTASIASAGREALQRSGWCDDVRSKMRAVKRCHQQAGDFGKSRALLIEELQAAARKELLAKVPQEVKQELYARVQSLLHQ